MTTLRWRSTSAIDPLTLLSGVRRGQCRQHLGVAVVGGVAHAHATCGRDTHMHVTAPSSSWAWWPSARCPPTPPLHQDGEALRNCTEAVIGYDWGSCWYIAFWRRARLVGAMMSSRLASVLASVCRWVCEGRGGCDGAARGGVASVVLASSVLASVLACSRPTAHSRAPRAAHSQRGSVTPRNCDCKYKMGVRLPAVAIRAAAAGGGRGPNVQHMSIDQIPHHVTTGAVGGGWW